MDVDDETRPEDPDTTLFFEKIRKKLLTDRALHDQAVKAFVSFIQAYSKHEASYIFRIKDLDIIGLAKSFGLLRLPRMPELKDVNKDQWSDADVDWSSYAYANQAQEAKRLAALTTKSTEKIEKEQEQRRIQRDEQKKANAPWSEKAGKRDERELRKEKKKRKKEWVKKQAVSQVAQNDLKHARDEDANSDNEEDWSEIAREERMAKKLRRGEVSRKAFDAEFGDL
jgi:ATP-dependent RNA helicase DDX55/SPB4